MTKFVKNALKRVMSDLCEYKKNPIDGIKIYLQDEDIFEIHGDIIIKKGIYAGITLPFIIHIPNEYPFIGPAMNIHPGIDFNNSFHEHLHADAKNGSSICNDMLTNFESWFKRIDNDTPPKATGWSPGYTLSTILMLMQIFFSEPDLPTHKLPNQSQIDKLKSQLDTFYANRDKQLNEVLANETADQEESVKEYPEGAYKLICSVTKEKLIDSPDVILGYPLKLHVDRYNRLWATPILELLSYDAYVLEIQKNGNKLDNFDRTYFKSANGESYNYWIPCYFTLNHFTTGRQTLENALSVIRYGVKGTEDSDFTPNIILRVLPTLINKAVVAIIKGDLYESEKAVECYCNFLQLLLEYLEIYPELKTVINLEVQSFLKSQKIRNKRHTPDIGEFIIKLSLSDYKYTNPNVQHVVLKEYFCRQIYWMFKTDRSLAKTFYQSENIDLKKCFAASNISSSVLVFALEAARFFIFNGIREKLRSNYGFPPQHAIKKFQNRIKHIKHNMIDYESLMCAIKYDKFIKNNQQMKEFLRSCCIESYAQTYTTFDPDYRKNQTEHSVHKKRMTYTKNLAQVTMYKKNAHQRQNIVEPCKEEPPKRKNKGNKEVFDDPCVYNHFSVLLEIPEDP